MLPEWIKGNFNPGSGFVLEIGGANINDAFKIILGQISTKDLTEELNKRTDYAATEANIEELKIENKDLSEYNHLLVKMLNRYMSSNDELIKRNISLMKDSINQ